MLSDQGRLLEQNTFSLVLKLLLNYWLTNIHYLNITSVLFMWVAPENEKKCDFFITKVGSVALLWYIEHFLWVTQPKSSIDSLQRSAPKLQTGYLNRSNWERVNIGLLLINYEYFYAGRKRFIAKQSYKDQNQNTVTWYIT